MEVAAKIVVGVLALLAGGLQIAGWAGGLNQSQRDQLKAQSLGDLLKLPVSRKVWKSDPANMSGQDRKQTAFLRTEASMILAYLAASTALLIVFIDD